MAIRITRIDDIDGSDGAEAVVFELDRKAYEIDLCARNRVRFLRAIAPFIDRARLVEDNGRASTVTMIVRRTSGGHMNPSEEAGNHDKTAEQGSGGPDLVDMVRRLES
jgi:hypothetical protein